MITFRTPGIEVRAEVRVYISDFQRSNKGRCAIYRSRYHNMYSKKFIKKRMDLADSARYNSIYRYINGVKATRRYLDLLEEKMEDDKEDRVLWANEWLAAATYMKSKKQLKMIKDYILERGEGFFRDVVGGYESSWRELAERYANAFGTSMKEDVTGFADFLAAIRMVGKTGVRSSAMKALRAEPIERTKRRYGTKMMNAGKKRAYQDIFDAFAGDKLGRKHAVSQKRLADAAWLSLTSMKRHLDSNRPSLPPSGTKIKGAEFENRQYFLASYKATVKDLLYNLAKSDKDLAKLIQEKDFYFGKSGFIAHK